MLARNLLKFVTNFRLRRRFSRSVLLEGYVGRAAAVVTAITDLPFD
jgi:hypothetical protein